MKIIQRYIAYNFLPPFLISTLFFVLFLLTFQLFRITKIIINKGVEAVVVLELVGHIAISFLPMAIPLSALIATIYTMSKLSEDSEIIAMRSFGINKNQLFSPLIIIGFVTSLLVFSLNQNIIPYSKKKFKNKIIKLTSKGVLTNIKANHFFTDVPNVTLFAEKVKNKGKNLENIFIHIKSNLGERIISAKKGFLLKDSKKEWDISGPRLNLINGNIIKKQHNIDNVEKIIFKEYEFPLLRKNSTPGFVTKDSMRTSGELYSILFGKNKNLLKNVNFVRSKLEFWSRLNTPITSLMFILIGFCLGIKKGRGRSKNTGALALLILLVYYSLFFLGISMAKKGTMPPILSIFIPTILLGIIGAYFYKKLDWPA